MSSFEDVFSLREEGNRLFHDKNYEEAARIFCRAIELAPNNSILFSNRSACYLSMDDYVHAESDARRAVDLDPRLVKGWYRLASALRLQRRFDDALTALDAGLSVEPSNKSLISLKVKCLSEKSSNEKSTTSSKCEPPMNPAESDMLLLLQSLMRTVIKGDGLGTCVANSLQGTFYKLMDKPTFLELLYPASRRGNVCSRASQASSCHGCASTCCACAYDAEGSHKG